uniref:F-box domain-containing protein n=1 Tax=Mycena chlorophos TaxID=658473 RepID=A0ABQ0LI97_MYCCL|nr:predicted protein [Mycena chlorophos]
MTSRSALRLRLEEIDTESAALRARLEELATARTDVAAQLEQGAYLCLPELPVEIMSQIFLRCAGIIRVASRDLEGNGAFILAQVCSRWRAIALGQPELWAHLDTARFRWLDDEMLKRKLQLCVERAGKTCNMVVSLSWDKKLPGMAPILSPTVGRWTQCEASQVLLRRTLEGSSAPLSSLHTLKIRDECDGTYQDNGRLVLASTETPWLRRVEILYLRGVWQTVLPWNQITELSFGDPREFAGRMDSDGCMDILEQTPNLEKLYLLMDDRPLSQSRHSLRLEKLRDLTLQWRSHCNGAAIRFLEVFDLPRLVAFSTCVHDAPEDAEEWEEEGDAIRDMIVRSKCGPIIRSLTLDIGAGPHIDVVRPVLASTPMLNELKFTGVSAGYRLESLFRLLASKNLPSVHFDELYVEMVHATDRIPFEYIAAVLEGTVADVYGRGTTAREPERRPPRTLRVETPPDVGGYREHRDSAGIKTLERLVTQAQGPQVFITSAHGTPIIGSRRVQVLQNT